MIVSEIAGVAGTFCMRPGRMKSSGEIDLDALIPLQPLPTKAINATEVVPATSDAILCDAVAVFTRWRVVWASKSR